MPTLDRRHWGSFLLAASALLSAGCSGIGPTVSAGGRNIATLFRTPDSTFHVAEPPSLPGARLAATWIGHATVLVQIDDRFVLTDPFLTTTAGLLSKRLIEPGIAPDSLPRLDAVVISHLHIDHLSYGSLDMIESKMQRLIVPERGLVYTPDYDCRVDELPRWQTLEDRGLRITAVPVNHPGWRYGLDDAWMTKSSNAYVIEYHGITVYFGGDTGYDSTMFVETSKRFPSIDLAFLPIAPIHPRDYSGTRHTDPIDALRIFRDLRARAMVPIHFDTLPESFDEPGEAPAALRAEMGRQKLTEGQVAILDAGERRVFIQAP